MLTTYKVALVSALVALGITGCSTTGGSTADSSSDAGAKLAAKNGYQVPRLENGQPDFQGVWTNISLTGLTRSPTYDSLTISPEQAERVEQMVAKRSEQGAQPTDPNEGAPPKGSVGGYNSFWIASGDKLTMIDGEYRTSWIVDPLNGQLPYTEVGMAKFKAAQNEARTNFDGPEPRSVGDRCLVGFGSTGGPPMLNVMYNNNYRFVQSDDAVMILVEMNHDARIIRLNSEARPENMDQWLGDTIGWWEGDTLVFKTKNIKAAESLRLYFGASYYLSTDAVITERLTRVSDNQMFYEFTVDDPEIFTQPWKGEMAFSSTDDAIYEYACHEGNYALPNILSGARREEKL